MDNQKDYGVGAQILRDLGVTRLNVLMLKSDGMNNPHKELVKFKIGYGRW